MELNGLRTAFILINVLAFLMFGLDKLFAKRGEWRIPEAWLILAAALGGAAGALLAMGIFRHKTRKLKFTAGIPAIMLAELAVLIVYALYFK